jgi:hypothetical protein
MSKPRLDQLPLELRMMALGLPAPTVHTITAQEGIHFRAFSGGGVAKRKVQNPQEKARRARAVASMQEAVDLARDRGEAEVTLPFDIAEAAVACAIDGVGAHQGRGGVTKAVRQLGRSKRRL